nr:hypothetical protein [Planococcus glaciei]
MVDYAHTPDAVSYCLETVKLQGAKRIIHVLAFVGTGTLASEAPCCR